MIKKEYFEISTWFLLSVFLGIKSILLGLGTFSSPGPGFMPFMLSLLLLTLSLVMLVQRTFLKKEISLGRVTFRMSAFYIVCYMLGYVLLYKRVGYLLSTFLLMTFLFKSMGAKRWLLIFGGAFSVSVLSYVVFRTFLKLNLPPGILQR